MSSSEKDTAISILGRVWLVAVPYWPQISFYYHHLGNFHEEDVMTPFLRRSPNLLWSLLHTSCSACRYCTCPKDSVRPDGVAKSTLWVRGRWWQRSELWARHIIQSYSQLWQISGEWAISLCRSWSRSSCCSASNQPSTPTGRVGTQ
jgi:hypothetical protein